MFGRSTKKGKWHVLKEKDAICSSLLTIFEKTYYTPKKEDTCERCIKKQKGTSNYRTSVPKALKDRIWDTQIGPRFGEAWCYVCSTIINSKKFEAGHVKSVANGGATNIRNLKCICGTCNKSMGTQNLEVFRKQYFSHQMRETEKHYVPMEID